MVDLIVVRFFRYRVNVRAFKHVTVQECKPGHMCAAVGSHEGYTYIHRTFQKEQDGT